MVDSSGFRLGPPLWKASDVFHVAGMEQDAVAEALRVDVELAMVVANRPQDEPSLQRKLWLSIAKHMIAQQPQPGAGSQAVGSRHP